MELYLSALSSGEREEDEWGKAQQRLILYLRSLKIPPFDVLELALEALKMAREKPETAENGHPVTASMRALRMILSRRKLEAPLKAGVKQMMPNLPFLEGSDLFCGIQSVPPLNRGIMVPERSNQKLSSQPTSQPSAF